MNQKEEKVAAIQWIHDPKLGIHCSLSHREGFPDWQVWKDSGGWRLKGRTFMKSMYFHNLSEAKAYAEKAQAEMEA